MITKRCSHCHRRKALKHFFKDKSGKYGVNQRCRPCYRRWFKKYYRCKEVKARYAKQGRESSARAHAVVMKLIAELGGQCVRCGQSHPATLDFHHKDPKKKVIGIGEACARRWSEEHIRAEAKKCILICASCHRIHHFNERQRRWQVEPRRWALPVK